jgi:voltage-gated potassium channel Kch
MFAGLYGLEAANIIRIPGITDWILVITIVLLATYELYINFGNSRADFIQRFYPYFNVHQHYKSFLVLDTLTVAGVSYYLTLIGFTVVGLIYIIVRMLTLIRIYLNYNLFLAYDIYWHELDNVEDTDE